jgi:hypothetical protein
MSHYRKVDVRIWMDSNFMELSHYGKLAYIYILTHPNMTSLGSMRGSMKGIATELNMPVKYVSESHKLGMWVYDEKACFIGLPNFLKYNPPQNPNVIRNWGKAIDTLPECDLRRTLLDNIKSIVKPLADSFRKAFNDSFNEPMID